MPNNFARDQEHEGLSPALLRIFRQQSGLSYLEIAGRLGIHRSTWGRWERGEAVPSSWKMLRLALSQLYRELKNEQKTQENNRADHQHSSTAYSGSPR